MSKDTQSADSAGAVGESAQFVTMMVADQLFGIRDSSVHDVLAPRKVTQIALAPREVAGAMNLRGRIVTAIDVRRALDLPPREDGEGMYIVVEKGAEFYSLMIDSVGEVMALPQERYEQTPVTLNSRWRDVSKGVYRLGGQLLVVLDVERLLDFDRAVAA